MKTLTTLLEEKIPKATLKAQKKIPYPWTSEQTLVFQEILKNNPRLRIKDKIITYSIFGKNDLINNKEFIKQLFHYQYNYNIPNLCRTCGSTYLNFNTEKEKIVDSHGKSPSFKGFPFNQTSLLESILKNKNYTPFYAYKNRKKDKYLICGGRHRAELLKTSACFIPYSFLCIFWDDMETTIECKMYLPNILLETSLSSLSTISIIEKQQYFSLCNITDPTSLWLTMKCLDREISYLVDFYPTQLEQLAIIPLENVMYKIISPKEQ